MGYLRPHQVEEFEDEKRVIERTLENRRDIQDRAGLQHHIKRIEKQVEEQAPPEVTGEERDRMVQECRTIEERLIPLMPSDEEMRKNPPGTVGRHKRYEKVAKQKDERFPEGWLNRWKDNQLTLNRGTDDPDVANFERMRPARSLASMEGAQIPGTQYFGTNPSQAYLEGHDRTFGDPEPEVESDSEPGEEPEEVVRKKAVRRKKATRKTKTKRAKVKMVCGAMKAPQGKATHERHCAECQEILEG